MEKQSHMPSSLRGGLRKSRCGSKGVMPNLHLYHTSICSKERRGEGLDNVSIGTTFHYSHWGG